jgi:hypothetical protein
MKRRVYAAGAVVVLGLLGLLAAEATPYWVDWEGDGGQWPESSGFERNWGDLHGQYDGPGAVRTIEDGVLTYDSLYDPGVCDFYEMGRPGHMDPGPGEQFVMEWRLRIDAVNGPSDPGVMLFSNDAWGLGYTYAYDHVRSAYEAYINIPFAAGLWHQYQVVSGDMRAYDLFIDGQLAHHGAFAHLIGPAEVGFGDGSQSASSVHRWDYFRFGVVSAPEPCALLSLVWVIAWRGARRG